MSYSLKYEKEHLLAEVGAAAHYSSEETEVDGKKEDNVSAVPADKDKTDTETSLTLVYDF